MLLQIVHCNQRGINISSISELQHKTKRQLSKHSLFFVLLNCIIIEINPQILALCHSCKCTRNPSQIGITNRSFFMTKYHLYSELIFTPTDIFNFLKNIGCQELFSRKIKPKTSLYEDV